MRGTRSVSGIIVACFLIVAIGGACSSSSSSNGDKAAFCKVNADISAKLTNVTSESQVIDAFKSVEGQFDSYVKNAPSEVKADAQLQVDAARKAIKDNNASQFQTDQKLQAASDHVDTFCGVKSSTSPASSSSSSTSGSSSSTGSGSAEGACGLFDLQGLNSATNLTWKVLDASQGDSCTIQAENGNTVAITVAPTSGQTAAALEGGKSRCDSGSEQDVSVADGGFACKVSGVNTAMAVYAGSDKLVAAAAVTFNNASDSDVQSALIALLKSFQAS
jgi:hypothetical protein